MTRATMERGTSLAAAILLTLTLPAALRGQSGEMPRVPVTGRTLEVRMVPGSQVRGELLGVEEGRMLLLTEGGRREIPLVDVQRTRVQRHGFTGTKAWTWVAIGAAVSGMGLAAACSTVEDASCGGVFPAVGLSWALIGGLLAQSVGRSAWEEVAASEERLRPFARFPQGVPDAYRGR